MTAAPRPAALRRNPAPELAIACPWCNARPGNRCTGRRGRTLPASHPSRITTPPAPGTGAGSPLTHTTRSTR